MAAKLEKLPGYDVQIVSGGLGELSVTLDGQILYSGNRLLYPRPSKVVAAVRERLRV